MVEELRISGFTNEKYRKYVALALPLIRDGDVRPSAEFEDAIGLPRLSSLWFLGYLRDDGFITGGHLNQRRTELTPLGHRAVRHIITVKDDFALIRVKVKIPEG